MSTSGQGDYHGRPLAPNRLADYTATPWGVMGTIDDGHPHTPTRRGCGNPACGTPGRPARVGSAFVGTQYAEYGVYFWDYLHYQPAGRPNLQGPAMRPEPAAAEQALRTCFARDAAWIAAHCEHNTLGDPGQLFGDPAGIPRRARARGNCRVRVARMQIALLLYAYAIEPSDGQRARRARDGARGLAWMQALVGDPEALDYRTAATHAEDFEPPLTAAIRDYIEAARGSLLPRPRWGS